MRRSNRGSLAESTRIERYEGTCIDVSILLYRNEEERRDRLTFTAGPRVRMKQDVEELLFRADRSRARSTSPSSPGVTARCACRWSTA